MKASDPTSAAPSFSKLIGRRRPARAASSRQALTLLIGLWLLTCLLVPRLAVDVSDRFAPVPTPAAFSVAIAEELKKGIGGHDPEDQRLDGVELAEGERHGNDVMDRQFGKLWAQYRRQSEVQRWFSVLSSLNALRPVSMALAGNDLATHRALSEQAEQYRRGFIAQINEFHTQHGKFNGWSFTADAALWEKVPPFEYREPTLAQTLRGTAPDIVILITWALVALGLAFAALRSAPVGAA